MKAITTQLSRRLEYKNNANFHRWTWIRSSRINPFLFQTNLTISEKPHSLVLLSKMCKELLLTSDVLRKDARHRPSSLYLMFLVQRYFELKRSFTKKS